jgi:hypothetical protein
MSTKFKPNDRVTVTKAFPDSPGLRTYNRIISYPAVGWNGTIRAIYNNQLGNNNEYAIRWDNFISNDLVREWMIEKLNTDWDE